MPFSFILLFVPWRLLGNTGGLLESTATSRVDWVYFLLRDETERRGSRKPAAISKSSGKNLLEQMFQMCGKTRNAVPATAAQIAARFKLAGRRTGSLRRCRTPKEFTAASCTNGGFIKTRATNTTIAMVKNCTNIDTASLTRCRHTFLLPSLCACVTIASAFATSIMRDASDSCVGSCCTTAALGCCNCCGDDNDGGGGAGCCTTCRSTMSTGAFCRTALAVAAGLLDGAAPLLSLPARRSGTYCWSMSGSNI